MTITCSLGLLLEKRSERGYNLAGLITKLLKIADKSLGKCKDRLIEVLVSLAKGEILRNHLRIIIKTKKREDIPSLLN